MEKSTHKVIMAYSMSRQEMLDAIGDMDFTIVINAYDGYREDELGKFYDHFHSYVPEKYLEMDWPKCGFRKDEKNEISLKKLETLKNRFLIEDIVRQVTNQFVQAHNSHFVFSFPGECQMSGNIEVRHGYMYCSGSTIDYYTGTLCWGYEFLIPIDLPVEEIKINVRDWEMCADVDISLDEARTFKEAFISENGNFDEENYLAQIAEWEERSDTLCEEISRKIIFYLSNIHDGHLSVDDDRHEEVWGVESFLGAPEVTIKADQYQASSAPAFLTVEFDIKHSYCYKGMDYFQRDPVYFNIDHPTVFESLGL